MKMEMEARNLTVCAISDLHGYLPEVPECDVLLIAGDICPATDHSRSQQSAHLNGPFRRWLNEIPAAEIVGIAGNHDFVFQHAPQMVPSDLRWTYLEDNGATLKCGLKVWGTPWTPWFYDWAFNAPKGAKGEFFLREKFAAIPAEGTDVVVSHGPPLFLRDKTVRGEFAGSLELAQRLDVVRPQLAVFGHIHEGRGSVAMNGITYANVCHVDENYRPVHKAMTFSLAALAALVPKAGE